MFALFLSETFLVVDALVQTGQDSTLLVHVARDCRRGLFELFVDTEDHSQILLVEGVYLHIVDDIHDRQIRDIDDRNVLLTQVLSLGILEQQLKNGIDFLENWVVFIEFPKSLA